MGTVISEWGSRALFPVSALVVAGGAGFATYSLQLGTGSALGVGLVSGTLVAAGIAFARETKERRAHFERESDAREARREAAFRLFWEASADFEANGWARGDLDTLRMVCRNISPGEELGDRVARRLREAVSNVLAGVIDRLGDVVVTARDIGASPRVIGELERAGGDLVRELEGASFVAGQRPLFDAHQVARAADRALEICASLREAVRPRIVSDLGAIVTWIGNARQAARLGAGELRLKSVLEVGTARVAVRPLDLSEALDALIGRIFAQGQIDGPLDVEVSEAGDATCVTLTWPIRNRFRVDPAGLLRPLRVLSAYGAQVELDEDLEQGVLTLVARLPRATAATA